MTIHFMITHDMGLDAVCVLLVCDCNLIQLENSLITVPGCAVPSVAIDAVMLVPQGGGTAQWSWSLEMAPCCTGMLRAPRSF